MKLDWLRLGIHGVKLNGKEHGQIIQNYGLNTQKNK